jgi:hypothetical protein
MHPPEPPHPRHPPDETHNIEETVFVASGSSWRAPTLTYVLAELLVDLERLFAVGRQAIGCQPAVGLVRNTRRNLPIWISSPLASTADCTG